MPPSRRQLQKAETRRVILEAAYALFEERGYERTTMRALASRAGVALGTIFQHFPDKPALLVAAFQDDVDGVVRRALATLPDTGVRDQLLHLVRRIFAFYGRRPALGRTLVKEILFLDGARGQTLELMVASFLGQVGGLLHAAVERRELPGGFDESHAVLAFWSIYFLCLLGGLREPRFDVNAQLGLFERLMDRHLLVGARP